MDDRDAAKDIVQQACVTALSIARSDPAAVDMVRNPWAWMVRITRNLVSGLLRMEARRRRLRRENGDEIRENLFPDPGAGRDEDARAERVLEAAPRVLTKRQLEVFRLVCERTEDGEIARELGVKPATVRRHRAAAIRKLREHMFQAGGGDSSMTSSPGVPRVGGAAYGVGFDRTEQIWAFMALYG